MNEKEPLLLHHGALAEKSQFESFAPKLDNEFDVHTINFEGHGCSRATDRPFRIKYFVENALDYLDENAIGKVNIFGYSMGGYVALSLAKNHPERVKKIATLGTILQWDEKKAESECRYLEQDKIIEKVPHFAKKLNRKHQCGWKVMVQKTREMLQHLGSNPNLMDEDWRNFKQPVRFHVGDRDTTAGLESTIEVYQKLENGQLTVFPDTPHPFDQIDTEKLVLSYLEYFKK